MNPETYADWWALHLRVVRGDNIGVEEERVYREGLAQLHQEESINGDVAAFREARARVTALEAEHAQLQMRRDKLEAEIAALEATLSEHTRELLGV